jgi:sucrose phosphorylase
MKNQVQLITYIDRLPGGNIQQLRALLRGPLRGLFGGVHLLPFFTPIDGADAGFDPIDHTQIDPRLGDWKDLQELGNDLELMADLIVNHISSQSPQFLDFSRNGDQSAWHDLFLTYGRIFPQGATEEQLLRIYRPRPGLPFTYTSLHNGQKRLLWTTFTSQQIDIDVLSAQGQRYLQKILQQLATSGIRAIRLDAAGYAIKKAGTNCFMIPETFDFISDLTQKAHALGIEVLVEIHSHYLKQSSIAQRVDLVYDFALSPLLLHALFTGDAEPLAQWIRIRPNNAITVLDTHDGIGVIDVGADAEGTPGLLAPEAIDKLVETIHANSHGESRQATGTAANNLDLYQVNCTYFDALGQDVNASLLARAVQFFVPGIPQVYYMGLLGGRNDMELLKRSGTGRDINRHFYTAGEVEEAMRTPFVSRLFSLIRFRNQHPAFSGSFDFTMQSKQQIDLIWHKDEHHAVLHADFSKRIAIIEYSPLATGNSCRIILGDFADERTKSL